MIDLYTKLPQVYFNESRDFQIVAKVYETLFNYIKTNSDLIKSNLDYKTFDKKLLVLLSKSLGFEATHNYNDNSLYAICSCFKDIMKKKGTKAAIVECVKAILASQGIKYDSDSIFVTVDYTNCCVDINLPSSDINDIILVEDILDYILPAGFIYSINQNTVIRNYYEINLTNEDVVNKVEASNEDIGTITKINSEDDLTENPVELKHSKNGSTYNSIVVGLINDDGTVNYNSSDDTED